MAVKTFKRGQTVLVTGWDMQMKQTYEPVKIMRRADPVGDDNRWHIVRFEDGGRLCVHESRMEMCQ